MSLTGENDMYNYSKAVHVYPPFFDITCSAKNYKIAPALTLHYNINHPNSAIEYFNYRGNRGTCNETHYIRADSLEQVV